MWFGLKAELQWGRFKMVLGTNCGGPGFWPCKDRCCVPWGSVHTHYHQLLVLHPHTSLITRWWGRAAQRLPLSLSPVLSFSCSHPHKINRPHSRRTSCLCATSWGGSFSNGRSAEFFPSSGLRRHLNFHFTLGTSETTHTRVDLVSSLIQSWCPPPLAFIGTLNITSSQHWGEQNSNHLN